MKRSSVVKVSMVALVCALVTAPGWFSHFSRSDFFPEKRPNNLLAESGSVNSWSVEKPVEKQVPIADNFKIISSPLKEVSSADIGDFSVHADKSSLSSDVGGIIAFTGTGTKRIESVLIGEKNIPGKLFADGSYVIAIERNTFQSGEYFLAYVLDDGTLVTKDEKITFYSEGSSVGIVDVTPSSVPSSRDSYIVLQGFGFSKLLSLQLGNGVIFKEASFTLVDDRVVFVRIPKWLEPGTYALNLMDTKGIHSSKTSYVTIRND